jgi:DNA-binding IclR family transcriptional regulator
LAVAILLGVAIRDGLLRAVADRPREPEEVAGELGLDARAVYVVLAALAELGVLEEEGEGFRWPMTPLQRNASANVAKLKGITKAV